MTDTGEVDTALEATVALNFSRLGYQWRDRLFDWTDLTERPLDGRVVIVTGSGRRLRDIAADPDRMEGGVKVSDKLGVIDALLESQRELPAHIGLPVDEALAAGDRGLMERTSSPVGESRTIQEDARVVDEPRHPLAVLVAVQWAAGAREQHAAAA